MYFPNSISHNEHSTHNALPCLIMRHLPLWKMQTPLS